MTSVKRVVAYAVRLHCTPQGPAQGADDYLQMSRRLGSLLHALEVLESRQWSKRTQLLDQQACLLWTYESHQHFLEYNACRENGSAPNLQNLQVTMKSI